MINYYSHNMQPTELLWLIFFTIIIVLLGLDIRQSQRQAVTLTKSQAWFWSGLWIGAALSFNAAVYLLLGTRAGHEFMAGYIVEKALSVDNLFVFTIIFRYFAITPQFQHRVLFYGVAGAVIFRGLFIITGLTFVEHLHSLFYVFGLFLLFSSYKLLTNNDKSLDLENSKALTWLRSIIPIAPTIHDKFFIRIDKKWCLTSLTLALISIEVADIVFAVDSVPAVLAITQNSLIVFTSNIFAIMGLRSLYFIINDLIVTFHYLNYGLSVILGFIGVKLLIMDFYTIPTAWSLSFIIMVFMISITASYLKQNKVMR